MYQVTEIPLISIDLTPDIATKLRFMVESGVFDIRGGSATLMFDPSGKLKSIKRELYTHSP